MKKFVFVLVMVLLLVQTMGLAAVAEETTTATSSVTTTLPGQTTLDGDQTTTFGDGDQTTVFDGEKQQVSLIIFDDDGYIAARVFQGDKPIQGIDVYLKLDTTIYLPVTTDENGKATFANMFPQDNTYVYCYTTEQTVDGITYLAAAASVGNVITAESTTTGGTVATTGPSYGTTSPTKYPRPTEENKTTKKDPLTYYTAPGTTGMESQYITVDFTFDSGVLDAFGVKEKKFAEKARLLMPPENYTSIIGGLNGVLVVKATVSGQQITDELIGEALKNDPVLSRVDTDKISRVALDLSMQTYDPLLQRVTDMWNVANGAYVYQLPIPHSMRSAETIMVSALTADGMSEPIFATISKNGFIRFETTSPVGTVVVMGHDSGILGALTGRAVMLSIIFLVVGLLFLGGAVFVFIKWIYLPKYGKKKEAEPVLELEIPEQAEEERPEAETEEDDPAVGLDIFGISTEQPTKKNPADFDLPL